MSSPQPPVVPETVLPSAASAPVDRDNTLPRPLLRELRTDHAGETGAVMIYRGVLAVARDPALREFARHHLETEQRHLALVEQVVPVRWRSRLLPLWRVSGWLTGALPALAGPRAVYATIQAVETFVDRHYAEQLEMIDGLLRAGATDDSGAERAAGLHGGLRPLRALLAQCQADEIAHRDDAAGRWDGHARGLLAAWTATVGRGSEAAVRLCRHL
jgi:ubiquinone biosynthesis monooxygenase Coq7